LLKRLKVSLIVMGTSGAGEIPDTLAVLNSTTTELMGRKICPVLAVPAGARANPIRKIVLALDAEPVMATVLAPLARFAKDARAEVLLLTVFTENNTSEDTNLANNNAAIEDLLAGIPVSMHTLKADDVAEGIRHFAESQQADLITAVARKRGFFELLFHASISQKLALRSHIPILILPE
jgi:nucleotide-binding universal stress UspA family protein